MDVSSKLGPLPPIPDKPLPIKLAQATAAVNDSLRFPAVEEPTETLPNNINPRDVSAKRFRSENYISTAAERFQPAAEKLSTEATSVSSPNLITSAKALEQYQSAAAKTSKANELDQMV